MEIVRDEINREIGIVGFEVTPILGYLEERQMGFGEAQLIALLGMIAIVGMWFI